MAKKVHDDIQQLIRTLRMLAAGAVFLATGVISTVGFSLLNHLPFEMEEEKTLTKTRSPSED